MNLIGVTQRMMFLPDIKEKRDCLAHDWIHFLKAADLRWIPLPNAEEAVADIANDLCLSGILLTGGDDIGIFQERDETEEALLKWALSKNTPVVGVCRGAQLINVFFGGTLKCISSGDHVAKRHLITTISGDEREVNSYHQQVIEEPASQLKIISRTVTDNTVESFATGSMTGIMWHPEREKEYSECDLELFRRYFIKGDYSI